MRSESGSSQGVDGALLRVIVEQFGERSAHPRSDIEQFEQLALGMIDALDAESVAAVARPLCLHPETPPSLISRIFDKGGSCARAVFEFAPNVPAKDLLATAEHGPADLAAAIARRTDIDRDVVAALASRVEPEVLRALAANPAPRLDPAARRSLSHAARDDLALARLLLDRADLDLDPEPLFLAAGRDERAAITLTACRAALEEAAVETIAPQNPALAERLERFAFARDRDAMAAALADALDCRKSRARAIILDEGGEPLALALVALGLEVDAATRIFICCEPAIAHDPERVRALRALMRSTPPRAAARIVAAITGSPRPERSAGRSAAAFEGLRTSSWRAQNAPTAAAPRKFDRIA